MCSFRFSFSFSLASLTLKPVSIFIMKKFLLVAVLGIAGMVSANEIEKKSPSQNEVPSELSQCVTQTSTDSSGDTVSVSCCRTTFSEAFNCAAAKLKKAVESIEELN